MKKLLHIFPALFLGFFLISCDDDKLGGPIDPALRSLSSDEQGAMILQACNDWVDNANLDIDRLSTVMDITRKTAHISYKRILKQENNSEATDSFIRRILPYTDPATGICMFKFNQVQAHYILNEDSLIIEPSDSLEITIIQGDSELHGGVTNTDDVFLPVQLPIKTDGLVSPQGTQVSAIMMAVPTRTSVSIDLNGNHLTDVECAGKADYRKFANGFNSAKDSLLFQVSAAIGDNDLNLKVECKADNVLSFAIDWSRYGRLINRISTRCTKLAITSEKKIKSLDTFQLEANLTDSVRAVATIANAGNLLNLIMKFVKEDDSEDDKPSQGGGSSSSKDKKGLMYLISVAMNEYISTSVYFRQNPIAQGKLQFERYQSIYTGKWKIGPRYTTHGQTFTHANNAGLFDPAAYDAFVRKFTEFLDQLER